MDRDVRTRTDDCTESEATLSVKTLGTLRLSGRKLTRPRPLLLVAYLAHEGPTDRNRLARLFCSSARDQKDALSTTLGRLKGLVDRGSPDDPRVRATVSTDALEFQAAALQLDAREALMRYDGSFAQGCDSNLSPELEDWVVSTREALASIARDLHLRAATSCLAERHASTAWEHVSTAVKLTRNHALDSGPMLDFLHGVAGTGFLLPDSWWRSFASDVGDAPLVRPSHAGSGELASDRISSFPPRDGLRADTIQLSLK